MLTTLTKYNCIIFTSLGNYKLSKMIRQMWLERPSPKGLKPLMSAAPDWQPDLRNVKQYGITVSKPKFITLDNRTSAIFNEAAVSESLSSLLLHKMTLPWTNRKATATLFKNDRFGDSAIITNQGTKRTLGLEQASA